METLYGGTLLPPQLGVGNQVPRYSGWKLHAGTDDA